jgi:hypothetical protein
MSMWRIRRIGCKALTVYSAILCHDAPVSLTTSARSVNRTRGWVALGAFLGLAAWAAIGSLGLLVLRLTWPAYAAAEPVKAYTLAMLCARLGVACIACFAAGLVAARPAGPAGAWAAGTLLLVLSLPIHLVEVWRDYPAWYHVVYLLLLVPITGIGGLLNVPGLKIRPY